MKAGVKGQRLCNPAAAVQCCVQVWPLAHKQDGGTGVQQPRLPLYVITASISSPCGRATKGARGSEGGM